MKKAFLALFLLAASLHALQSFSCDEHDDKTICLFENEMDYSQFTADGDYYTTFNLKELIDLTGTALGEDAGIREETLLRDEPTTILVKDDCGSNPFECLIEKTPNPTVANEKCFEVTGKGDEIWITYSPACIACYPDLTIKFVPATRESLELWVRVPLACTGVDTVFLVNGLSQNADVKRAVKSYAKNTAEKVKLVDYSSGYSLSSFGDKESAPSSCALGADASPEEIGGCVMYLKRNVFGGGVKQLVIIGDEADVEGSQGIVPAYPVKFFGEGGVIQSFKELNYAEDESWDFKEVPSDKAFDADWLAALNSNDFSAAENFLVIGRVPFDPVIGGSGKMLEAIAAGQQTVSFAGNLFVADKCGTTSDSNCHLNGFAESFYRAFFESEPSSYSFKIAPAYCVGYGSGDAGFCEKKGELLAALASGKPAVFVLHGNGRELTGTDKGNPLSYSDSVIKISDTQNSILALRYTSLAGLASAPRAVLSGACFGTSLDLDRGGNALKEIKTYENLGRQSLYDKSLARAFLREGTVTLVGFTHVGLVSSISGPDGDYYYNALFAEKLAYAKEKGVSVGEAFNAVHPGNVAGTGSSAGDCAAVTSAA
ncbi:hypothetical protein COX85_01045, partial [Candidatus Micrarchaeota archaeon CG_4_10_14_0_2_um_filter_55_9]